MKFMTTVAVVYLVVDVAIILKVAISCYRYNNNALLRQMCNLCGRVPDFKVPQWVWVSMMLSICWLVSR